MSTSVTNTSSRRAGRTFITYLALTAFFFIFSRIYESKSYGEVSVFMHYLWCVPAIGGSLLLLLLGLKPRLARMAYNLWNSGVAVIAAGFLLRGIINLSGRSTTLDVPYWYIGAGFIGLAILASFLPQARQTTRRTRKKPLSA